MERSSTRNVFLTSQTKGLRRRRLIVGGSDGLTLPQLWDSHTHIVKLSAQVAKVDYKGSFDCSVAVGFVLDHESRPLAWQGISS